MRYIISDIHGCYEEYMELLEKIHFGPRDELYVLGDAMDRGPEPVRVMQDLMMRENVTYMVGNHDYMAMLALRKLAVEITEETCQELKSEDLLHYYYWMQDGGRVTAEQFRGISWEEQQEILEYLGEALLYEVLQEGEEQFVLVHAGLGHFAEEKALEDYDISDLIFERTDYKRRYYADKRKTIVTGHTPTMTIRPDRQPLIYQENGHIAVDCGAVFGGHLAAWCVETGEAVYVKSRRERQF